MIGFFLNREPAGDLEEFIDQAARALWLEERIVNNFARIMGAKK